MTDEERRQKIIDELQDRIGLEDVPSHAMSKRELRESLGIGEHALSVALKEIEQEGRLNSAKTYKINSEDNKYLVEVYWFDDEENSLHKA